MNILIKFQKILNIGRADHLQILEFEGQSLIPTVQSHHHPANQIIATLCSTIVLSLYWNYAITISKWKTLGSFLNVNETENVLGAETWPRMNVCRRTWHVLCEWSLSSGRSWQRSRFRDLFGSSPALQFVPSADEFERNQENCIVSKNDPKRIFLAGRWLDNCQLFPRILFPGWINMFLNANRYRLEAPLHYRLTFSGSPHDEKKIIFSIIIFPKPKTTCKLSMKWLFREAIDTVWHMLWTSARNLKWKVGELSTQTRVSRVVSRTLWNRILMSFLGR